MNNNPNSSTGKKQNYQTYPEQENSLPKQYGDNRIVIMPRDPVWLHAYWEINDTKKSSIKKKFGEDIFIRSQLVLRVYDVTNLCFNGRNAHSSFDISINNEVRNWYINTTISGRTWCVEIGLITPEGDFIVLARSNCTSLPCGKISDITDEEWMSVKGKFETLLKLSGIDKIGKSSPVGKKKVIEKSEMSLFGFSPGLSSPRLFSPKKWGIQKK